MLLFCKSKEIEKINKYLLNKKITRIIYVKNKIINYQVEKDKTVELNESIVLKYIQLKEQVKWQEEMIQKLNTDLNEITIKHDKREKFYTKYGFIG